MECWKEIVCVGTHSVVSNFFKVIFYAIRLLLVEKGNLAFASSPYRNSDSFIF